VSDEGPGIAEADRPRAMEPFVRLDPSRSGPGSGVGLALVSAVATLHAGSLVLADNAPGLIATLELPAAGRRPGQAAQDD
jgi:signal transduction histidine kinase